MSLIKRMYYEALYPDGNCDGPLPTKPTECRAPCSKMSAHRKSLTSMNWMKERTMGSRSRKSTTPFRAPTARALSEPSVLVPLKISVRPQLHRVHRSYGLPKVGKFDPLNDEKHGKISKVRTKDEHLFDAIKAQIKLH